MTKYLNSRIGGALLAGLVCLAGCKSPDEADTGQMASVTITGHTEAEIVRATMATFIEDGYTKTDGLVFEKKGSTWESFNYGGWSGEKVWTRVKVMITTLEPDGFILGCDAFAVQDHGSVSMEDEHKFLFDKRSDCKKILDQVKAALDKPATPPKSNTQPAP
jgi:hypothetical protein